MSEPLALAIPPEMVEAIASRAADLVVERLERPRRSYLTVDQAAAYISCPRSRIYALASAGRIPHRKDGSRLLFAPDELDGWLEQGGAKRP